jgi:hypothetical protein
VHAVEQRQDTALEHAPAGVRRTSVRAPIPTDRGCQETLQKLGQPIIHHSLTGHSHLFKNTNSKNGTINAFFLQRRKVGAVHSIIVGMNS